VSEAKDERERRITELRPRYQRDLADGTERFFAPRRTDCPWCGNESLSTRLRTTDLLQHKPGQFVLDRCETCGHTFQNPQLTEEGLEFYYRDFYDGLGEKQLESLFDGKNTAYLGRARSMTAHDPAPKRWLDVGTGQGHFCAAVRDGLLPDTSFDGLDFTEGVEIAEREKRVERGFRGSFPALAGELAGQYDVVSMYHYLEHTADPDRELRAARQVVRPGGHLLVEVPDAESRLSRVLGRWWLPWLQPQHLHFMPVANLRARLEELGFTVVSEEHAEPHAAIDLVAAVWLALGRVSPPENTPWLPEPPSALRRATRTAVFLAGIPALLAATTLDRIAIRPLTRRWRVSNAYRVVARRE